MGLKVWGVGNGVESMGSWEWGCRYDKLGIGMGLKEWEVGNGVEDMGGWE